MHLFDVGYPLLRWQRHRGRRAPAGGGPGAGDHLQGRPRVTACFFGDGAVAEGEFHESMNLAALWHLPVLFCCENNLYAMGTALERAESETDLSLKAACYRVPSWEVDGMDVLAVEEAAARAAEAVRAGGGPHFLELRTYRFRAHSMYDPDRYRDKAEIEQWKHRDPIPLLSEQPECGQAALAEDDARPDRGRDSPAEIDDAVAFADAGTLEPVEDLERFVTSHEPVERDHERHHLSRGDARRAFARRMQSETSGSFSWVRTSAATVGATPSASGCSRSSVPSASATRPCRSRRSSVPASARRSAGCARSSRS